MSRETFLETILLEVDGPQIIVLRDPVDTLYLGLLAESTEESSTFLCMAISSRRLAELRQGKIDLREAFLSPEISEYFSGRIESGTDTPLDVLLDPLDVPPSAWLPDEGFFLHDFLHEVPEGTTTVVTEATERQRAVVYFSLNPPEGVEKGTINADRLAKALESFQNMVRHAYKKVIASLSQSVPGLTTNEENYTLEVLGFAHHSFGLLLQSKVPPDLFGFSNLSRALKKVDELTGHLESPEATLEVAKQNRGHLVSAYKNFLKFISENNTPITYSWAEPFADVTAPKRITPEVASTLYDLLVSQTNLGTEQLVLTGTFIMANIRNGAWALKTTENREYYGQLLEGEKVSLSGIVLDTQRYRIVCEEHITETSSSGRQSTKLLLRELRPL